MAGELAHVSVGTELTQEEFEGKTLHQFNSQAVGDIAYASSTTQISRLAKGANGDSLTLASGVPAWNTAVQTNATASRVSGTIYQNTSGRPLLVTITAKATAAGNPINLISYTDTSATPTTVVAVSDVQDSTASASATITFLVLPSSYYKCIQGGDGALSYWFEWEI